MMEKYYKTGEFARMANLSVRTIRYYDQIGLLKPTKIADNGYRLYSDNDFIKLQKILSLKSLGFSLDDIFSMTANDSYMSLQQSLKMQKKMIDSKLDQLENMRSSLEKTENYINSHQELDWQEILRDINFDTMEKELVKQYKDSTNVDIRIKLHEKYSVNPVHWFEWLFSYYHLQDDMKILEVGCGNGQLWLSNKDKIKNLNLTLSDVSQGMIDDASSLLKDESIHYACFDCQEIPYNDKTFDALIANHVLFYVQDLNKALSEISRVLKPGGYFYCSTYGKNHMKEITELVKEYNPKIQLSNVNLYEIFGLENGKDILKNYFSKVELERYDDYLMVDNSEDMINYILSCHGNQSDYIMKDYDSFKQFVERKMNKGMKVTKDAGLFICQKG